ncbi:hypothetical protein FV139_16250 [Parahaliea maris]|uniref:FAD:protein FMN transferase n=1 Tax=Parahaliea maris TaxID=2716870 RepID=A0A5C8ZUY7_9GAMM|nr:FAD:protein FMN transferase [Parahaliea maris]TXS91287.1 hypothetical protein FV139_16250 [Parahaliea maris]
MHGLLEIRFHVMGRACHLAVADNRGDAAELLDSAKMELLRLQERFDVHNRASLTASLSRAGSHSLDREALGLINLVAALRHKTNNIFDPSIQTVSNLWRSTEQRTPPTPEAIDAALRTSGWQHLAFNESGIQTAIDGLRVNLASCLCPYAVDRVYNLLSTAGVTSALIDLDKDVRTIGRQPDGSNWLIGLRYPHGARAAIHRLKLNGQALSSRGNFERRLQLDGENFSRTFSPVDGYPVPGLLSVSVAASSCVEAASAANAGRCLTEGNAIQWLEGLGLPWLGIDRKLGSQGPLAPPLTSTH